MKLKGNKNNPNVLITKFLGRERILNTQSLFLKE